MKPQKEINGVTFYPVPGFTRLEVELGACANRFFNRRALPATPKKYEDIVSDLFFNGGHLPDIHKDVDKTLAILALRSWLRSFDVSHEAKIATAAYALWVWSELDTIIGEGK